MKRYAEEAGFTIIELLVSISILGIIITPLAASLIVGMRTSFDTTTRLSASNDRQFVATYLVPDIQSATDFASSPGGSCAAPPSDPVLSFSWMDGGTSYGADYGFEVDGSQCRLVRTFRVDGEQTASTVVARGLRMETGQPSVQVNPIADNRLEVNIWDESGEQYSIEASKRRTV